MSESVAPLSGAEQLRLKRAREARATFVRLGMTVTEWARSRGYRPAAVYKVLSGETQGLRGKSHEIAVKLGIKEGELPEDRPHA